MTLPALKQRPQPKKRFWYFKMFSLYETGKMRSPLLLCVFQLQLFMIITTLMCSYVNAQDYYFSNPNVPNRFVPSSQYQNRRPLSSGSTTGAGSPGSYQEQILFIGNESKQPQNQPLTSAAYTPFGQQYTNNRNNDYYDISPRPFGVPGSASGAASVNTYTRSKSFKPSNSFTANNGFVPQRVNVPQFLQQFNEPTLDKPASSNRLPASTGFGNSVSKPFGNGGFTPSSSRNRPAASSSYNGDTLVGPQTSQQLPFRSSRNRFQPSSSTTTTTSSTTEYPATSRRYNRFGGRTQNQSSGGFRPAAQTTTQANNPELSRLNPATSHRKPAFVSREVNEPIQSNRPQKNYPVKQGRVKLPVKDKFLKPHITGSTSQFRPGNPFNLKQQEDKSLNDEYEEAEEQLVNKAKEPPLEKLQLQEAEVKPSALDAHAKSSEISLTTIKAEETEETEAVEAQNSANASQSTETQKSEDNEEDGEENYSDDYSQEEHQETETTTDVSQEEGEYTTVQPVSKENETNENEELDATVIPATEPTTLTKNSDLLIITTTESSALKEADKMAATLLMTTTESSGDKQNEAKDVGEEEEELQNEEESSADYDDEDYEDEEEESGDDVESGEPEEEEEQHEEDLEHEEGSALSLEPHEELTTTSTTTLEPSPLILDREVVSVVTTKSVVNGSTAFPSPITPRSTTLSMEEEAIFTEAKVSPASNEASEVVDITTTPKSKEESLSNTTEGYVVVASIQTSRSINGARFLPFPAIQQEESKKYLSELERNAKLKASKSSQDSTSEQNNASAEMEVNGKASTDLLTENTSPNANPTSTFPSSSSSTESIIDKLDRVQSELSSGLLAGKYPIISQMGVSTPSTTSTSGNRFAPNIRKFQPKTTPAVKVKVHHFGENSNAKVKVHHIDDTEMDELTGLLPEGFKRPSYKNRRLSTTTSTTTRKPESDTEFKKPLRNSTIGRSFKNTPIVQDVSLAGLLPKGYKLQPTTTTYSPNDDLHDILSKIQFDDNLDKLLPKDYKAKATTAKPAVTLVDDISKFLPPGYKLSTTPSTIVTTEEQKAEEKKTAVTLAEPDDITKFLPPGYKLRSTRKPLTKVEPEKIDISQLLPKGYKETKTENEESPVDILKKIEFKEVASLLPPGFKLNNNEGSLAVHPASTSTSTTTSTTTTTERSEETGDGTSSNSGFKVVFPKGIHKRKGAQRLTTPRSTDSGEQIGGSPPVVVRKGPPTRATTEFTGWPTPSTTPISIEKLLEQAKTATINFEDLLPSSSTTTTTTSTTTTTTTTTPKPTKPGFCTADCDLAATIKIIDGVAWKPELLDHNTAEWKNLAREVEAQLNEVYSKAPQLSKWYKKVRIDSFSKGSVLVDYYVELANITKDVNTLEIKKLFHEALTPQPMVPHESDTENETDNEEESGYQDIKEEKLVKETFLMGKYVIDPVATDFSVIPKPLTPNVEFAEEDLLIPQWAIVVIVIGVGSLVFVVIFGITVLLNRQNRAKKTPIPLTNDMLNELKINHMGGVDNYGVDDFYNIDDTWNDTKQPIKPKRFTNSMNDSSGSNIYDSWRSTRHGDYYYDSQNNYSSQKGDTLQRSLKHHPNSQYSHHSQHQQSLYGGHQYPDAFADAHQMYTYNNQTNGRSSRYARDYDPDF